MSAQESPAPTQPETNTIQTFADTAFEPNPSFHFDEVHDQERDPYQGYTPMEDIRSHGQHPLFNPVNGQSSLNSDYPFSMEADNYGHDSAMLGHTLNPANMWPTSSPSNFQNSNFPAPNGESRIVQNRPHSVMRQHGQITPPDDDSGGFAEPGGSEAQIINAAERARTDKSERARNAAVQRHAKTKKQRKDSQQSKSSTSDDEVGEKKEKYREKNRLAAAKCRAKKKDNIEGIEDRHRNLSALNSALKKQVQDLRGELTNLRTHALNHQGCNCRIARYNVNQARKVAMGVDGVGSPTGYGTFGHDNTFVDCDHGQRPQSITDRNNASPGMGQMSRNQSSFAAPSSYAFASVTTPNEMNAIHGSQGDNEAPFANYLQSGYGDSNGYTQ